MSGNSLSQPPPHPENQLAVDPGRTSKFKIDVPAKLEEQSVEPDRPGIAELTQCLTDMVGQQNRLRDELAEQTRINHELERKHLANDVGEYAALGQRIADMADQQQRLRDQLAEQVKINQDLEQKRIAQEAEHERGIEVLQRQRQAERTRIANLTQARDTFQGRAAEAAREASAAIAALADAEAQVAGLSEALNHQNTAATVQEDRLREADEMLVRSARRAQILERRAQEVIRRGELEREVSARSAEGKLAQGLLGGYWAKRILKQAREAMRWQDWAVAERLFGIVALRFDDRPEVWLQLGHARRELELYATAADAYARSTELAPQNGETFFWLGLCLARDGDEEAAQVAYRQALEHAPALASQYDELRQMRPAYDG